MRSGTGDRWVVAHGVPCPRAKHVAVDYLNGHPKPLGFRCHRYPSAAGAGWYAKCTRQGVYVQITPE